MSKLNLLTEQGRFSDFYRNKYGYNAKNINVIVTHGCNLRCTYCYEHHKDNNLSMTKETARKIVDLLFEEDSKNSRYLNEENAHGLVFDFIGGEPLLEIDLISYFMDYFREKAFKLNHRWLNNYMINMTSNGINYFDKKVQDFLEMNYGRVSISITVDGNEELHNTCRLFPNGEGSYSYAAAALKDIVKKYNQRGTKLTFAKENIQYLYDAIVNMIEEFDLNYIFGNCAFEPEWNKDDARTFYYQLKKLADYLIDTDRYSNVYIHLLNADIGKASSEQSDTNWCGGTGNMLAFDINGEIYPCLRYAPLSIGDKQPKLLLGNLEDGLLNSKETIKVADMLDSITRTSQSEEKCLSCPIGGGCAWCSAYNYEVFGTPNKRVTNICIMHQARVLAKYYYINKLCNKLNYPEEKMKIRIPEDWALDIISKEEFEMIKNL